ncbi:hypothetical protein SAV14893_089740 [Streptomyces avermitilis]|uniref:Uncharacterized protein n=1 Tax=Streptomyces avermitilis TaxID=33903 RepID=A0A4D4N5K0_STRAX|nr:hypothetical protein SAV14893_089740 [Streptomyces avermitilis]GDY79838.1 hypothetical protein SAV31267_093230 [Streptomyces avermitilis]
MTTSRLSACGAGRAHTGAEQGGAGTFGTLPVFPVEQGGQVLGGVVVLVQVHGGTEVVQELVDDGRGLAGPVTPAVAPPQVLGRRARRGMDVAVAGDDFVGSYGSHHSVGSESRRWAIRGGDVLPGRATRVMPKR